MNEVLFFESSTNLKDLVGRRLVTNKISALFELVKNSFDADADEVKVIIDEDNDLLIISDDGDGMSLQDIKDKWMVIGTDNKKGSNYTPKGRPLNGEKGIGRFSVDRLGKHLKLSSTRLDMEEKVQMGFDWELFEDQRETKLNEVPIAYTYQKKSYKKGVILEISGLRDLWTESEVKNLEKRLRGLLSPFSDLNTYPFKIILDCKKYGFFNKVLQPYELSEISSLWIEAEIPIETPEKIFITLYRNGAVIEEQELTNSYEFGPVKTVIYSFDKGDKTSFHSKFKENVKDFGNIRIYRDFFQIFPYGEINNDWLDLEPRKSQGHFRYLGIRDMVGYIQIFREHNPKFIDATNRQGLEENSALSELRHFISKVVLPKLEEYFFLKKYKTQDKEHVSNRQEITNATKVLKSIASDIKQFSPVIAKQVVELSAVIQETNQKQDKIIKSQQHMVEVYKRLSSKETLLHGIIHQVLIRIESVISAVWNQRSDLEALEIPAEVSMKCNEYQEFILETTQQINEYLLNARDYLLKKREKMSVNLYEELGKVVNTQRFTLLKEDIECSINGLSTVTLKVDVNDFKVIFENLLSNSIKSLVKVTGRTRKIEINYEVTSLKLNIFVRDNGIGLKEDIIPHVFTPFYTTNNKGFGMGLSIVDELVKANSGEINVVKTDEGATFQISFDI